MAGLSLVEVKKTVRQAWRALYPILKTRSISSLRQHPPSSIHLSPKNDPTLIFECKFSTLLLNLSA